jgi:DNA-binding transcriptional MocR family regulator
MREALDAFLPRDYRRLPAEAGLHLAVTGPRDPADPGLYPALLQRGLLVSSLRLTYSFSPGESGFLLGFAALPSAAVAPAMKILGSALT